MIGTQQQTNSAGNSVAYEMARVFLKISIFLQLRFVAKLRDET